MKKYTIIITDSPTNDFMSPREKFQQVRVNIGLAEISRLIGEGEHFGEGPLPYFIKEAIQAKKNEQDISNIFIRDLHNPNDPIQKPELLRFGNHNIIGTPGADFIFPFQETLEDSYIIDTTSLTIPIRIFQEVLKKITNKEVFNLSYQEKMQINFVLTGVYTDIRVLSTAIQLRHEYGFPNVYVSPHLVGSKYYKAHVTALQVEFPNYLIQVVPGLDAIFEITGLRREELKLAEHGACSIFPKELSLNKEQKMIIENLFLFHSKVELTSLSGGYSGSLLFIAQGEKDNSKTEQVILKIDKHFQIQKEVAGYNLVKDFLGKHVPSFSLTVFYGEFAGIKMELASMIGKPETLQAIFEESDDLKSILPKFEYTFNTLKKYLYQNIKKVKKIYPYKEFGLHNKQQEIWLLENTAHILSKDELGKDVLSLSDDLTIPNNIKDFQMINKYIDRVVSQTSLCHGDLNLANIITDKKNNVWFIDWTHTSERPIEFDIAKIENDIKFVLEKRFLENDLIQLKIFESFLLSNIVLPKLQELPKELLFVCEDIRFKKIYTVLQLLRNLYVSVKEKKDSLYKLALLKYSVHTLSFDERRGRGECKLPQLKYALLSTTLLIEHLKNSELHKKIHKDKPDSYPERYPVPKDKLAWETEYSDYNPPYYVDKVVLENDENIKQDGWADPEDFTLVKILNPKGRTGLKGRGLLGRWGANFAVDPVITRINPITEDLEILLIKRKDNIEWALPGGIAYKHETIQETAKRAIGEKTSLDLNLQDACLLFSGFVDDYRNTDHSWIESTAIHKHISSQNAMLKLRPGKEVLDTDWITLSIEIIQNLFANHSEFIGKAMERLLDFEDSEIPKEKIQEILLTIF